ncbi:hypothetical protein BOX15_Mlig004789g2 [Macrostomum lignano]|uniref:Alpha-type protein kinase domain-containing protein n=1 Tax=Macrostomum lignano TaxID=282301 RepID=A0A267DTV4_9PLAT|nr:hypothetical protein BOX15_Mlig004789g2 [Macrostomum lignano]
MPYLAAGTENGAAVDDDDDLDCSMPELASDISIADLGCEADNDDDTLTNDEAAAAAAQRRRSGPRRLSLQQRRRLNLYSKPAVLPSLDLMVAQQQQQSRLSAVGQAADRQRPKHSQRDTPTIREEDSGCGSAKSPDTAEDFGSSGSASKRGRTVSEPLDSPDTTGSADAEHGAKASEQGPGLAGKKPGIAARIRTVSASHSGTGGSSRWPRALNLVFQNLKNDVWRDMPVASIPEETAIRHRYNAHKRQWVHDTVRVKIEPTPFNRGAMRECFRLKKLSGFSKFESWHSRACNYVAKKYIETVDPSVYFEDARLQMNAKLWAQEYNRHNPPKKVDIMQMYVIEFKDREGAPLYHLEHHIEGEYIKHNSNSGFVDENARRTPHALSHFTFERSGHQLIVVDIQGVDDIYTDPQIHTAEGKEYGDGNLGVRGMALFFSSHVCNDICRRLRLSRFDLAPSECVESPSPMQTNNATCVRGDVFAVGSPMSPPSILDSGCSTEDDDGCDSSPGGYGSSGGAGPFGSRFRRRRTTSGDEMTPEEELAALSAALKRRERPSCVPGNLLRCGCDSGVTADAGTSGLGAVFIQSRSEDDSVSDTGSCGHQHQPLPGMPEVRCNGPILGRIHHEMTRLHDAGRMVALETDNRDKNDIVDDDDKVIGQSCPPGQLEAMIDWPAALFHERLAAQLGVVEAAVNLARLHLGLPADCLQAAPAAALRPSAAEGHRWMEAAAKLGDRSAMLYLARAHDTGDTEGLVRDWDRATHYYHRALASSGQTDREGGYDSLDTPAYLLRARLAELYLRGGYGLDADPASSSEIYGEAAEEAMAKATASWPPSTTPWPRRRRL